MVGLPPAARSVDPMIPITTAGAKPGLQPTRRGPAEAGGSITISQFTFFWTLGKVSRRLRKAFQPRSVVGQGIQPRGHGQPVRGPAESGHERKSIIEAVTREAHLVVPSSLRDPDCGLAGLCAVAAHAVWRRLPAPGPATPTPDQRLQPSVKRPTASHRFAAATSRRWTSWSPGSAATTRCSCSVRFLRSGSSPRRTSPWMHGERFLSSFSNNEKSGIRHRPFP